MTHLFNLGEIAPGIYFFIQNIDTESNTISFFFLNQAGEKIENIQNTSYELDESFAYFSGMNLEIKIFNQILNTLKEEL